MKTPKPNLKTLVALLALACNLTPAFGQTINWTGAGDGTSWHNPANWTGGFVPDATNDVAITSGAGTNVVISSGGVTVKSIQCSKAFTISSGSFTVTAVASTISGLLTVAAGASLSANGAGVTFTATGTTTIDGASLSVSGGSVLSLPEARSFQNANANPTWQASGTGSVLALPGLTNLSSSACCWIYLKALSGGQVLLTNLPAIASGYFNAVADGTNSLIDLTALRDCPGNCCPIELQARNGGAVWVPQLLGGPKVSVNLGPNATLPVAQLRMANGITVNSMVVNFPALTNIVAGSAVLVEGGAVSLPGLDNLGPGTSLTVNSGTLNMASLASLDGASLFVSGGSVLSLPGVRSFQNANANPTWQASGTGSVLELPGLTNLSSVCCWTYLKALSGGQVLLRALEVIPDGYVEIMADGPGSTNDVRRLSSMTLRNGQGRIVSQNAGVIVLGQEAFLLANVAINIPSGNPVLPPTLIASPTLTLYGKAWHSYWVEQRDALVPGSPWVFAARAPLTSAFQDFAPAPPANTTFRVWEFVAEPAILDLNRTGSGELQLVLYGAPLKSFEVLTTNSLPNLPASWPVWATTGPMTNSLRMFPAFAPPPGTKQFFKAKEN